MPSWRTSSTAATQRDFPRANARKRRLRAMQTPSEKALWRELQKLNREGASFRRQPAVGPWVFDFGYLSAKLLIEVDGGVHEALAEVAARDEQKTRWAEANGFRLLRVANREVWEACGAVIERLRSMIPAPHPLHPPLRQGEGGSASTPTTED